jgi:hypothetical protein
VPEKNGGIRGPVGGLWSKPNGRRQVPGADSFRLTVRFPNWVNFRKDIGRSLGGAFKSQRTFLFAVGISHIWVAWNACGSWLSVGFFLATPKGIPYLSFRAISGLRLPQPWV